MRAHRSLVATVVIFGLLAVSGVVYWYISPGSADFNRTIWLQGESSRDSPRLRMADRLVKSKMLLGKSKGEVEAMLGPPTSTDKFSDAGLVYWLGPERGFISIDSEWLTLNFDQAGKVDDIQIVTD